MRLITRKGKIKKMEERCDEMTSKLVTILTILMILLLLLNIMGRLI